jgi:spore coat protein U-like protein
MRFRSGGVACFLLLLLMLWPTAGLAFKCNVTATGLSFGGYDALNPVPASATAVIEVTCNIKEKNKAAPLTVSISVSSGSSGNFGQRSMTHVSGADVLYYNLYMEAGGGGIWGDGGGGSENLVAYVTQEAPVNAKIYGKIPAGQNVLVGSYSDAVTVSILY